jgi:hypothetical protein
VGTSVSIGGGSHSHGGVTVYGQGTVVAGNGQDTIGITGGGKILVGSGKDSITLDKGGTIQEFGKSGHDTIHLGGGSYTYDVTVQGDATVKTGFATFDIEGGGSLKVDGDSATLIGAHGSEYFGGSHMVGHGGNETFVGGSGHDTMWAGSGHDIFEFTQANAGGTHVIENFVAGMDQLYLEGKSFSWLESHGDVSSKQGNTYISLDNGHTKIELVGVKPSDLTHK